MVNFLTKFWKSVKVNSQGVLVGGVFGAGTAAFVQKNNVNVLKIIIDSGKGVVDSFLSRSAVTNVSLFKLYLSYIIVGMMIGYTISFLLNKGKK